MKFIVLTKKQVENISGKYGKYSAIQPVKMYRNKYLAGYKVPYTKVEEWVLPIECLDDPDLKVISGFLKCFPVYDAEYWYEYNEFET